MDGFDDPATATLQSRDDALASSRRWAPVLHEQQQLTHDGKSEAAQHGVEEHVEMLPEPPQNVVRLVAARPRRRWVSHSLSTHPLSTGDTAPVTFGGPDPPGA